MDGRTVAVGDRHGVLDGRPRLIAPVDGNEHEINIKLGHTAQSRGGHKNTPFHRSGPAPGDRAVPTAEERVFIRPG
jgi:hypothetical protein